MSNFPLPRCHAGAGHAVASPRGVYGDLCEQCWAAVCRLRSRWLGREVKP